MNRGFVMDRIKIEKTDELLRRLHLLDRYEDKLTSAEFLQIRRTKEHEKDISESDLSSVYLHKLLMLDYRARYIQVKQESSQEILGQDDTDDFFDTTEDEDTRLEKTHIHPLDVQMAVFHCADSFLKQKMVTKLSQCQYALPILVPDPFTGELHCPLWTFREIKKSWKKTETKDSSNVVSMKSMSICKAATPMLFCLRLGDLSVSKSQLINTLINDRHSTFFHRNCPGSTKTQLLFEGVAEIAWYCPAGKPNDNFTDCVAFCNLHGDGLTHNKQMNILLEMSSINIVFVPKMDRNHESAAVINRLLESPKPLIALIENSGHSVIQFKKVNSKYKVGLKNRTLSDVSEDLKKIIRDVLSSPHKSFQLESMSETGFRVDENDASCTKGLFFAKDIMKTIQSVNMSDIKNTFLPCQGQLWHNWCRTNKDLYRLQRNIEVEKSLRLSELQRLREKQCEVSCSELIQSFVKHLSSSVSEKDYFLKWTQILLDTDATECLTLILETYHQKWSELLEIKKNPSKPDELRMKQAEFSKLSTDLQSATCGLEHIFREMAQIYEAHKCLDQAQTEVQTDWSKYPQLAAELLISGHPMELMDGDAGHVPLTWISSVMDQLIHRLGDKSVFVLSVLGIQSSGKSTLLNAMFGLQFAVSAGRCTRGSFMQLVKLSEELKTEFLWDYILVVDTEGLRPLELEGNNTIHHDNELATFVIGIGNMTLVNIFGENPSEIQDILQIVVQAFMRMKKVKLSPSCVFVHQNVSEVSAEEKNMYTKRKLQEKLDKMVELAAKEEVCKAKNFSDIIKFDVHKDVKYFAPLWEGTPPMAPTNPGYSESVQDLRNYILTKAEPSPGIKLSMFKTKVHDLWNALLNENFVFSFKNTLEIAVYRRLEVEYGNWTWALRQEILNIEEDLYPRILNKTLDKVDKNFLYRELTKTYSETKQSMSEFFENDKDKEILIQWRGQHELKIQTFQDELVQGLKRKLNHVLEQKKASKELEERKSMFENKLLQNSKELAHQSRDKPQGKQELEQQFDQVWESLVSEVTQGMNPPEAINFEDDVIKVIHELGFEKEQITSRKTLQEYRTLVERGDFTDCVIQRKENLSSPEHSVQTQTFLSGYLPAEGQKLIHNLITKVDQDTSELIQREPVAERGYSPNYLSKMGQCMQKSIDTFESEGRFNLRKDFKVDLMLYVMDNKEKSILDSHCIYMKNNDARTYLDGKKEEYYSLFKSFYRESSSAVVLATLICDKIKISMRKSVINQTSIDIAKELKRNVPAFKQNRLNLEKHLLKSLAKKKVFKEYIDYIKDPRSYTEVFIREEVNQSLQDTKYKQKFRIHLMKNILNIKHHLDPALYDATEKTKSQNGDISMWLQDFTQSIKVKLRFKSISSENFTDVNDFDFLKKEVEKGLKTIVSELKSVLVTTLKTSRQTPDQILIDQLCDCCWETCPFCGAACTNSVKNHKLAKDGGMDHSVPFHRSPSVNGFHYKDTKEMSLPFCTTQVAGNETFHPDGSKRKVPYKRYREAGPPADTWSITPDHSQLSYWQWMVCTFKDDLENNYSMKYCNHGEIPKDWKSVTLEKALANLEEMYKTA